ncbi:SDR family oxidoreductase [Micromonospora andamanensis]|uniref:SDR family oxidoreductase n=1 Tax=Micromonospora andamanensis TaxID=1287068 RepID=UPI00195004E4|nr:SDR family oxidoreductase [Micromonospora andamanensis]GIJ37247.1 short-chain dehydrogenase [Micromonospora andamanensis]
MAKLTLSGKVVAITGGSLGIGRATAEAFIAAGAQVAIGARDLDRATSTARSIGAIAFPLDVTDSGSVEKFCRQVEEALGPIDVLINNAGVMLVGRLENESDDATAQQLNVNLLGTINGMKAVMPRMRARGRGHIINMVSAVGMVGLPGCATYSAAKHGVVGLSEAVRGELRGAGVDLSIILPIPAQTELTSGVGKGRFVPYLKATDIAGAAVRTARRPRYHVYVPGWTNPVTRILGLLPQGLRDAAGRLLKADQLLKTTDAAARVRYEERARATNLTREV